MKMTPYNDCLPREKRRDWNGSNIYHFYDYYAIVQDDETYLVATCDVNDFFFALDCYDDYRDGWNIEGEYVPEAQLEERIEWHWGRAEKGIYF